MPTISIEPLTRRTTTIDNVPTQTTADKELRDSLQQPVWHVLVLGGLTLVLPYILYWAYKTWRDLKLEASKYPDLEPTDPLSVFKKISPGLRTAGLLIPLVNIYLFVTLILGIIGLNQNGSPRVRQHPFLSCGLVVGSFLGLWTLARLPGALYLLWLLSVVPFGFVQHWINQYWVSVEEPDRSIRHAFSTGEMFAIIAGASYTGLLIAGQMIGVKLH